ncbi:hypothetical protein [Indioceanicola profundi]|uniref:hypothetical protein n=1 Tax=Indioceanicola profundi TaxID=2220096 RepID=UPI000E6AA59D|nr:hypothetical protein [Indioceanicola profundi]
MPLRLLIPVLVAAGWLCLAAAPVMGLWLALADGPWIAALTLFGAALVCGLMLLGFAANLKLISELVEQARRGASAAATPPAGPIR